MLRHRREGAGVPSCVVIVVHIRSCGGGEVVDDHQRRCGAPCFCYWQFGVSCEKTPAQAAQPPSLRRQPRQLGSEKLGGYEQIVNTSVNQ
jgi:hypothetical protein